MSVKKQQQPSKKLSVEEIEQAIIAAHGNISEAAESLGLASRYRLRERITKTPRLSRALSEAREKLLGLAEGNVVQALKDGDLGMTNMVLKNFGRHAGWLPETQRIEHVDDTVEVVEDWGEGNVTPDDGDA